MSPHRNDFFMSEKKKYPTVLSIAGSDSIGGAGIQADIKTATSLGVYSMTAVTAVTIQNTLGVAGFHTVPPEVLRGQLDAIVNDVYPDIVKVGMIPDRKSAEIIAEFFDMHKFKGVVIDPVLVATSGDSLSEDSTMDILNARIIPHATLVTPNIPESEALTGEVIRNRDMYPAVAEKIIKETGCRSVLVKGGLNPENGVVTAFFVMQDGSKRMEMEFPHPEITTMNTHGTGCTLSSAIASYMAKGFDLLSAVRYGIEFLQEALDEGSVYEIGKGHGGVNHMFKQIYYENKF